MPDIDLFGLLVSPLMVAVPGLYLLAHLAVRGVASVVRFGSQQTESLTSILAFVTALAVLVSTQL